MVVSVGKNEGRDSSSLSLPMPSLLSMAFCLSFGSYRTYSSFMAVVGGGPGFTYHV
jgi:hypothetical protein